MHIIFTPEMLATLAAGALVTIFWCLVMKKVLDQGTRIITIGISLYVLFFLPSVGLTLLLKELFG